MLSSLKRKCSAAGLAAGGRARRSRTLQERTSALAESIRTLSHELHPGVLKHAGLVATLRRHCADIERTITST